MKIYSQPVFPLNQNLKTMIYQCALTAKDRDIQKNCHLEPRYVKCKEKHNFSKCPLKFTSKHCVDCKQAHAASL